MMKRILLVLVAVGAFWAVPLSARAAPTCTALGNSQDPATRYRYMDCTREAGAFLSLDRWRRARWPGRWRHPHDVHLPRRRPR
jgi:hypothetical protein